MRTESMQAKPVKKPRPAAKRSGGWNAMWAWVHRQSVVAKTVLGGIAAAFALITAGLTIDDRYARAGDVSGLRSAVDLNSLRQEIAIQNLRKAQVMDKLIDLQGKERMQRGRLAPHEKQALDRFAIEHADLTRDIDQKQRAVDRARLGR